jgi:GDP-mannose 6-dehydrogenase
MTISVFGLGYVGAVSCACFADLGFTVIGVDINEDKVKLINRGLSPIAEPGLDEMIKEGIEKKKISATINGHEAVLNSSISIVCVGTPSRSNGGVDMTYIEGVFKEIGMAIKEKNTFHTVLIRSTVPPRTIENCTNILAQVTAKIPEKDFAVISNPEFLREGTAIKDFYNPPYTVLGSNSNKATEIATTLYEKLDAPIYKLKPEESELIKYANNNFHALKITFANEIGNICKELGVDSHAVMNLVAKDKKLNLSSYYMKPGFAFGGSCLPKDVRALNYISKTNDLETPMLNSLMTSNEMQVKRALNFIFETGIKQVGFLGFAFKANTDDLRESPVVTLIETLIGKGYQVKVYDSNVYLSKLMGKNKDFLTQHIPHINNIFEAEIEKVIESSELLIIGNKAPEFEKGIESWLKSKKVLDLVRIKTELIHHPNYMGICW